MDVTLNMSLLVGLFVNVFVPKNFKLLFQIKNINGFTTYSKYLKKDLQLNEGTVSGTEAILEG